MSLRIRRGTDAERATKTFVPGELVWTTDTQMLYLGNGVTAGGVSVAYGLGGTGIAYNSNTGKLDLNLAGISSDNIPQGSNNKYFSNSLVYDAVWPMLVNGTHQNISFTYNNVTNKLNATVTLDGGLLTVEGDTSPKLGGNLSLNGHDVTGTGTVNITGNITASHFYGPLDGNVSSTTGNIATLTSTTLTATNLTATNSNLGTLASGFNANNKTITNVGQLTVNTSTTLFGTTSAIDLAVTNLSGPTGYTGVNLISSAQLPLTVKSITTGTPSGQVPNIELQSSKGTLVSPTNTVPGDFLYSLTVSGFHEGSYVPASNILTVWDPTADMTKSSPASVISIQANNNTNGLNFGVNRIIFYGKNGLMQVPIIQPGSYNGSGEYPVSPQAGWIIFDTSDSHFYGFNGTVWKQLDN